MEVADHTKTQLRGPSLWTCVEHTIRANMECRVYNPGAGLDEFQSPLVGGEPMIRWIFMQVRAFCSEMCRIFGRRAPVHFAFAGSSRGFDASCSTERLSTVICVSHILRAVLRLPVAISIGFFLFFSPGRLLSPRHPTCRMACVLVHVHAARRQKA